MDWVMKLLMGGWIPEGKRSQWTAAAVAFGAIVVSIVQWGAGDMGAVELAKVLADKWAVFAVAYYGYFVAEKVDNNT